MITEQGSKKDPDHCRNTMIINLSQYSGIKAHCLIDSRCKGIMISPNFIRAAKIEPFPLDKPIGIQSGQHISTDTTFKGVKQFAQQAVWNLLDVRDAILEHRIE